MSDPKAWVWDSCSRASAVQPGEAHVWLVELSSGKLDHDACWSVLTDHERKRSERFKHDGAREEFVVSRAMLRTLLARYVDVDSNEITYRNAPGGKPFLVEIPGKPAPWFNMTHSHGVALYAISLDQEVGVDVEMLGRRTDAERVAKRFFTERESERIMAREPDLRKDAFIRTWTCKEACLKWTGAGLKGGLKTHEILFDDAWGNPEAAGEVEQPLLTLLEPAPGWVGALAVRGEVGVSCRVWEG